VGFEWVGGWDSGSDEITTHFSGGKEYGGFVQVTFADVDYFSATDDAGREGHFCEALAVFSWSPSDFMAMTYAYDSSYGGDVVDLWGAYEGFLTFNDKYLYQDECYNLDPDAFAGGTPVATFDGMHFGLGFGELSPYHEEQYWGEKYVKEYGPGLHTQYIAVNHPDGNGGYDFIGYDWTAGILWSWDTDTHEVEVDEEGLLVLGNVGDPVPEGYVGSYAYWYEDFPNLDFSLLQEMD